jgi:hypothetical protein
MLYLIFILLNKRNIFPVLKIRIWIIEMNILKFILKKLDIKQ